jgi:hypothetical protein
MGEYKRSNDNRLVLFMLIISLIINITTIYKCARFQYETSKTVKIVNNFFEEMEKNGIGIE